MNKTKYYMDMACAVSKGSTCLRAQCGAVIVKDDRIISTGFNGSSRGDSNCVDIGKCARDGYESGKGLELCKAVHAEVNAVINAGLNGSSCEGGILYLFFKRIDGAQSILGGKSCPKCISVLRNAKVIKTIGNNGLTDITEFEIRGMNEKA